MSTRAIAIFFSLTGLFASSVIAAEGKLDAQEEEAFKQASALVDPSIVRIETVGGLEQLEDQLLPDGPTSGVVVSADGYIITSTFNFVSKPTSILVTLPDGRRLAAKLVANDRLRLLTLLKVDVDGLVPAKPTPRNDIKVGQWALALGRTLDNSVPSLSVGIVSAVNRVWGKAIQTDAKTSPVNYGGALVDVEGHVMGVVAPLSPMANEETAGVEWYDGGIGFAIPMEDIYATLDRLKLGSDLLPGLLGINFAGGQALNVPAIVDRVRYNSPAQQAGLKTNDRIFEVDGQKVTRVAQFRQVFGRKYAGDVAKIVVSRDDKTIPLDITLVGQLLPYEIPYLGILPERTTGAARAGASVRFVFEKSPAAAAGLVRGDRILKCNSLDIKDRAELTDAIGRSRPSDKVSITYLHDERESTAEVVLGSLPEDVVGELPAELIVGTGVAAALEKKDEKEDKPAAEDAKPTDKPKTGRFTEKLEGPDHDFWAYVPENYTDSHAYGLVVWVHPAGDTMEASIFREWKSICDRRGLILVGPKAESPMGWQPGEIEFVSALIGHIREKYTIDTTRIVLHSQSSGAPMAWAVATKHRDVVRGVAVTGAPFVGQAPDNEPEYRQQFLFVCGDADKLLPRVKSSVSALRKLKFPVTFRTINGLGAKYPAEKAVDEIGRWVDSLDRI